MNKLDINHTLKSPRINFNPENGIFEISGVSLIENTLEFFKPINKWLTEYLNSPCQNTTFVFKLTYSNTSSLQFFYDIVNLIYLEHQKKTVLSVVWCYAYDDIDMKEVGEDYRDSFDVEFTFKPIVG